MSEFDRVKTLISMDMSQIEKYGAQPESVSLDIIAQCMILIAQELAIANDKNTIIEKAIKEAEACRDEMDEAEGSIAYSGMWEYMIEILKGEHE